MRVTLAASAPLGTADGGIAAEDSITAGWAGGEDGELMRLDDRAADGVDSEDEAEGRARF
jgi:hypothetical protein